MGFKGVTSDFTPVLTGVGEGARKINKLSVSGGSPPRPRWNRAEAPGDLALTSPPPPWRGRAWNPGARMETKMTRNEIKVDGYWRITNFKATNAFINVLTYGKKIAHIDLAMIIIHRVMMKGCATEDRHPPVRPENAARVLPTRAVTRPWISRTALSLALTSPPPPWRGRAWNPGARMETKMTRNEIKVDGYWRITNFKATNAFINVLTYGKKIAHIDLAMIIIHRVMMKGCATEDRNPPVRPESAAR